MIGVQFVTEIWVSSIAITTRSVL